MPRRLATPDRAAAAGASARQVHAVLAAAIGDPALMERLRRRPRTAGAPVDPAFDFDRIRLFAGLALKVRHGDVRLDLPSTFKLLDRLKLSIALFSAYARQADTLRKNGKTGRADKIRRVTAFIARWLDADDPDHALVRDIMHHECALLALRATKAPTGDRDPAAITVTTRSRPRRVPGQIRRAMSCDPLALERLIRSRAGDFAALPRGQFHYLYRRAPAGGGIDVNAVDDLAAILIDLADGRHSLAQIAGALRRAGVAATAAQLCGVTRTLVENSMLTLAA